MNTDDRGREPSPEEIATLAKQLYVDSGCVEGRSMENWLAAEKLLRNTFTSSPDALPPGEPAVENFGSPTE